MGDVKCVGPENDRGALLLSVYLFRRLIPRERGTIWTEKKARFRVARNPPVAV